MAENVKIGKNSICSGCEATPVQEECIKCFICKSSFHALCPNGVHLGTKTLVKAFGSASTKNNYKMFCDVCLTQFERNLVETKDQKVDGLVDKVNTIENKLTEITKLIKSNPLSLNSDQPDTITHSSIWHNNKRVENMKASLKAPSEPSALVVKGKPSPEQNKEMRDKVQQVMIDNNIPVTKSFTKPSGDIVMLCETEDDREKLKNIVLATDNEIVMNSPTAVRPSITIVGLKEEYGKKEIIDMLVLQNGFIKRFASENEIDNHIEIHVVRPLKNNNLCFQAFAKVSSTLREGISIHNNKVTIGLSTCKIYDRFHIKRCNTCQHFGHYMKDCPTPDVPVCGKCGGNHKTSDCNNETPSCINCTRDKSTNCSHHTFSHECPALKRQQEEKKKRLNNHLNFTSRNRPQQP